LQEPLKSRMMSWHINPRREYDMAIPPIVDQPLKLRTRIIFSSPTGHVLRSSEPRIFFTFQAPSNILREMEMQNIELILSHNIDLLFQHGHRLIVPAHIQQESPKGISRLVTDVHEGNLLLMKIHLHQGLKSRENPF